MTEFPYLKIICIFACNPGWFSGAPVIWYYLCLFILSSYVYAARLLQYFRRQVMFSRNGVGQVLSSRWPLIRLNFRIFSAVLVSLLLARLVGCSRSVLLPCKKGCNSIGLLRCLLFDWAHVVYLFSLLTDFVSFYWCSSDGGPIVKERFDIRSSASNRYRNYQTFVHVRFCSN